MSTAKSITATLAGAALHDGAIGSLEIAASNTCRGCAARLTRASRLVISCGCAPVWPGASTMMQTDGLNLSLRQGNGEPTARSVLDLLCELPSAQPQGTVFNYSSGEIA